MEEKDLAPNAFSEVGWSIFTHNGTIIVQSPSGAHKVFHIETQSEKAEFAPGSRILSLRIKPGHMRGFAFVNPKAAHLWKRYSNNQEYKDYVKILIHRDHYKNMGVEYLLEGRCIACNRPLTNPESIKTGIGPICAGKKHK